MKAAPVFHRATTWKQAWGGKGWRANTTLDEINEHQLFLLETWQPWMFKFHASRVWIVGNITCPIFVMQSKRLITKVQVFKLREENCSLSGVVDRKLIEKKRGPKRIFENFTPVGKRCRCNFFRTSSSCLWNQHLKLCFFLRILP